MDQPPAPARIEFALRAVGVAHGKAALRLGFRIDEIRQRLGLDQIELAVEKGAAREFAGFRMPDAVKARDRFQHLGRDRSAAMDLELGDILTGETARSRKKQHEAVVYERAIMRLQLSQRGESILNGPGHRFDYES